MGAMTRATAQEYTFTTLAGPDESPGAVDGTGSAARLNYPYAVAVDSAGNVYVADGGNSTIRKVAPGGVVTTLAGLAGSSGSADGTGSAARFNYTAGVALDSAGNVYVADVGNQTIRKVTPGGVVTTLAGLAGSLGSADGTGSAARFNYPYAVAADSAGNVYVADSENFTIRKVSPGGVVTTLAGLAGSSGSADGTASAARFNYPYGVAVDSAGNVYVADSDNYTIRKVTPGGVVTTLAGLAGSSGSADGTGSAARFNYPYGVAADSAGNVYVADSDNHTIRKVTPGGVVTTLAGLAGSSGSADGTASAARFYEPCGVAADSAGNVYVADWSNHTIRKVTPGGVVTTLAGLAGGQGSADGTASAAQFYYPSGLALDSAGNLYVADYGNSTIRKVTPGGVVTTLAGLAGSQGSADGTGSAARFNYPSSVAVDSAGNVYVADEENYTIRKVTPAGVVTTVAGLAGSPGSADGTGSAARFGMPEGVGVDSAGNVYVTDFNNHTIRKVTPGGVVTTVAGLAGSSGSADGTASAARFNYPEGVAVDSAGNVYVADTENHTIRKVTPAGVVTTLAGLAGSSGSADGTASAARFYYPEAVGADSAGNVYVADTYNCTIRKVTPAGVVTTLAGLAGSQGSADGTASAARFNYPFGVAADSAGKAYVADGGNNTIRIGTTNTCPDAPTIDLAVGPVGQLRQLGTSPQTAVAWQWRLIRDPAASSAALSAANVRNPTFTPDVADLYVFRLEAANAAGAICTRTLAFTALLAPVTTDSFNPGADSTVFAMAVQTDGKVLAGGDFTNLAQQAASYIGRINLDATLDTNFTAAADGDVVCVAIQPDGKILVGGVFTTLGSQASCTNLGRLNSDGTLDTNFFPAPDGIVQCLAVQADGKILVGGGFTVLSGRLCSNLGRLNPDGTLDTSFTPNPDQVVDALAVQPDGAILAGGDFLTLAGQNCSRLGRLNPDGTLDANFAPSPDNSVYVLAVQADGKVLTGGRFSMLGGRARSGIGRLNADGSPDTAFNPGVDGPPFSLALQADGGIVVGGAFQNLGGRACNFIGRLTAAGILDTNFLPGANNSVASLAIQPDGKVLVGGIFSNLGGRSRNNIGRLNNTGSATQGLSSDGSSVAWPRGGTSPEVWRTSFEVSTGTSWVSLGAGTRSAGGWILSNITLPPKAVLRARGFVASGMENGSGWFVEADSTPPTVTGSPAGVTTNAGASASFTVQASGTAVLTYQWRKGTALLNDGGNISGAHTPSLTLANLTGADRGAYTVVVSSPFGSVASAVANLMVVDPYISGQPLGRTNNAGTLASFSVSVIGAVPMSYQWRKGGTNLLEGGNISGSRASTLSLSNVLGGHAGAYTVVVTNLYGRATSAVANLSVLDPFITGQPASLAIDAGQQAVFNVAVAGTVPLKYQWRKGGTNIAAATTTTLSLTNAQRADIASYDVVVTNLFGKATSALAILAVNLAAVDSWNPAGADSSVSALAQQRDGKVLVGGAFATLGGQARLCLGRLNTDGSLDAAFHPGASNHVNALAVLPQGQFLVGGDFTTLGGQACSFLGRLNADGTLDTAFNPAVNGAVLALAMQADGKLLVGGEFTMVGGQARNCLARLNSDGTLDSAFNPVPNNAVFALAVQPDGKVLAGGVFTRLAGQTCYYLGRLNADGTLDTAFNPGANSWVYSLALQPDGKVLAGGVFTTLGGQTRWCVGRLNADGSLDANFNPNASALVYCLGLQADGKILLGGGFTSLGGQPYKFLGRLNADGSPDAAFNPRADGSVYTLALQANGALVAGGAFTNLDGQPREYVGRLTPTDPATDILTFDGSTINWLRGGTCPEVWRTTFETYIEGTGWVDLGPSTRLTNGWQLTGQALPSDAIIRARGYVGGAGFSCWFVESSLPPTLLTPPTILRDASFGFQANQFGFNLSGGVGQVVIVEASTNLADWTSLASLTLGIGPTYFSDPNASSFPARFYRVRLP
jgi:uncharacterized delta-60 repeat protein